MGSISSPFSFQTFLRSRSQNRSKAWSPSISEPIDPVRSSVDPVGAGSDVVAIYEASAVERDAQSTPNRLCARSGRASERPLPCRPSHRAQFPSTCKRADSYSIQQNLCGLELRLPRFAHGLPTPTRPFSCPPNTLPTYASVLLQVYVPV